MEDGDLPGPSVVQRRRRALKFVAVAVTSVVLVAMVAAGLAAHAINDSVSDLGAGREHLKPIPISAEACPYVEVMHRAANEFQAAYQFLYSFDAQGRPLIRWSETRAKILRAADDLGSAIVAASPHLPQRVQSYLAITRKDIELGRKQIQLARDQLDFMLNPYQVKSDGQQAFGYASDLVGNRCGFQLGADETGTVP